MRVAILGAGGIALKLHLPQLAANPEFKVVCLQGRKESRLRTLCDRFQVPQWTTDRAAVLADDSIEAVVVALPHPMHVPVGLEVLAAGKHLLMQKPLSGNLEEADAFVAAVERTDRTVMVLPHFPPEVYQTRDMLTAGKLGRVSGAHARTSHGGPEVYYQEVLDGFGEPPGDLWFFDARQAEVGALFDMGVYATSFLVAMLGSVASVSGECGTLAKPTELEDTATLLLRFAEGPLATAETGWCDPAGTWMFRVHGTEGKISFDGDDPAGLTHWTPGSLTREDLPPVAHRVDASSASRGNAHDHWLACIREGRHPELSHAWAARHVTEVMLAGLQSARTGSRVTLRTRAEAP